MMHRRPRWSPLPAALLLTGAAVMADPPPAPPPPAPPAAALAGSLDDLIEQLDRLDRDLQRLAEQALDNADQAPTADERRRYERLYEDTSARLAELRAVRATLSVQAADFPAPISPAPRDPPP